VTDTDVTWVTDLRNLVDVNDGESARDQHAADLSFHPPVRPQVVVYPESTSEVAAVLAYADRARIPVIPFGAGTSLEGHVIPISGGITLDMSRLNQIVAIRPQDLTATVQAGVTRLQLESAVGPQGLWFPVDPGADATLGGMAATNASGTTTIRYGGMRSHVLELEAVLPSGRIIRAGTHAIKTSAGYHIGGLLLGSEGTLGVMTELTLRLHPIPDHVAVARVPFPTIEAACFAAGTLIAAGIQLTRCELLDAATIEAVNSHTNAGLSRTPHLVLELSGTEAAVVSELDVVREFVRDDGATGFETVSDPRARTQMWASRHDALMALLALTPRSKAMTMDVAVPISELPAAIERAHCALDATELRGGIIGHVGDGNFHVIVVLDPADATSLAHAKSLNDRIVEDALARRGTCTGEHGIGSGKLQYLEREHPDLLPLYRGIKQLFDPNEIMNPGKVIRLGDAYAPGNVASA
jgi:D-lactate dehydrogenase (cytochrome)